MLTSKRLAEFFWEELTARPERAGEITERFLQALADNNLSYLLPQVGRYLEILAQRTKAERTTIVSFSHEPSGSSIEAVRKLVGASPDDPIVLKTDAELLGGFVAAYRQRVYDGSLRRKLEGLKGSLAK
ncbi:MAG TPA: F0F1 ATP synthase subunit delta [Candidatus Paceibacterota bacterium]|nr:F0F1 ATP synthase subunit delta [Candidatus Paceibacterota bacterium]